MALRLKKQKRLKTLLDYIAFGNKTKYINQEERALKRIIDNNLEYKNILIRSSSLK